VSGHLALSKELDAIIGSVQENGNGIEYYFGAPGNSIDDILQIEIP